jgi:hypothetical protein
LSNWGFTKRLCGVHKHFSAEPKLNRTGTINATTQHKQRKDRADSAGNVLRIRRQRRDRHSTLGAFFEARGVSRGLGHARIVAGCSASGVVVSRQESPRG